MDREPPAPIDIVKTIAALSIHDAEQAGAWEAEQGDTGPKNGWKMTAWGPRETDGAAGLHVELIDAGDEDGKPWGWFQFKLTWEPIDAEEPELGLCPWFVLEQTKILKELPFEDYIEILDMIASYLTEVADAAANAVDQKRKRKTS